MDVTDDLQTLSVNHFVFLPYLTDVRDEHLKQYQNTTGVKNYNFFGHFDATSDRFLTVNHRRNFRNDIPVWLFEIRENINSLVGYLFIFSTQRRIILVARVLFENIIVAKNDWTTPEV